MVIKYTFILLVLLCILSCQKTDNQAISYQKGIETSQTYVLSQQMTTSLLNTYFKAITDSILIADGMNKIDGAVVTFEKTPPQKLKFKYPYWGDFDGCGHSRIGTYEANTATFFNDPQGIVSFSFIDFSFLYIIECEYLEDTLRYESMTLTNLGKQDGINNQYNIIVPGAIIVYGDSSGVSTFSMDQQIKRLKDPSTVYRSPNDKFEIWGELDGISVNEYPFKATIDPGKKIRSDFTCDWLKLGPASVATERFQFDSEVCFPGADSCQVPFYSDTCVNQFLIVIDDNPFPYPIDQN